MLDDAFKTTTLGGLTADQWREKFRYEGGKLYFRKGKKADKEAGFAHPAGWMVTHKGKHYPRKDVNWLLENGWVPSDRRRFRVKRRGGKYDDDTANLELKEVTAKVRVVGETRVSAEQSPTTAEAATKSQQSAPGVYDGYRTDATPSENLPGTWEGGGTETETVPAEPERGTVPSEPAQNVVTRSGLDC